MGYNYAAVIRTQATGNFETKMAAIEKNELMMYFSRDRKLHDTP